MNNLKKLVFAIAVLASLGQANICFCMKSGEQSQFIRRILLLDINNGICLESEFEKIYRAYEGQESFLAYICEQLKVSPIGRKNSAANRFRDWFSSKRPDFLFSILTQEEIDYRLRPCETISSKTQDEAHRQGLKRVHADIEKEVATLKKKSFSSLKPLDVVQEAENILEFDGKIFSEETSSYDIRFEFLEHFKQWYSKKKAELSCDSSFDIFLGNVCTHLRWKELNDKSIGQKAHISTCFRRWIAVVEPGILKSAISDDEEKDLFTEEWINLSENKLKKLIEATQKKNEQEEARKRLKRHLDELNKMETDQRIKRLFWH